MLRYMGSLLLIGAAVCYGQHGRAMGHMGRGAAGPAHAPSHSNAGNRKGATKDRAMRTQKRLPEQALDENKKLASNLQKLLPAGTTPRDACGGFKNLGQCVAAIHVSHNLGVPFADLKSKMTGETAGSLGTAIHELRPDVDAKAEQKNAEQAAKEEIKASES